jgi:ubiquinone biosynthesis protein
VQRPGIRPAVERDLDIAQRIARRLKEGTAWGRSIGVRTLADGLAAAIREELDYRIEADNLRSVAAGDGHASAIHVPAIHPDLCTERVLVRERLHGTPVNAAQVRLVDRGLHRPALARRLLDYLLRQMLLDGVFHADPHAGNVFVLDDGRIGLLDFGSVGRVDAGLREALQRLLLAVDRGDPLGTSDTLLELVPRPEVVDQQRLERDLGRFLARHIDTPLPSRACACSATCSASSPTTACRSRPSWRPCSGARHGRGHAGATRSRVRVRHRGASAGELVRHRAAAARHGTTGPPARSSSHCCRSCGGSPRRIERIANAAEHGRLGLNVRPFADERDREVVTDLLHQVLLAFLAATMGVMAVLLLGTGGGPMVTEAVSLYALFAYNLLVVSAVLGLRVLAAIFRRS